MGELIDIVDEDDKVVDIARRSIVRKDALLHRVSVVIITDDMGNFLIQKRAKYKDVYPSFWEIGCGETLKSEEDYETAAVRGLNEEFGIIVAKEDINKCLKFKHRYRSEDHNVNYNVFSWPSNEFVKLQDEEIEEAKFLDQKHVIEMMKNQSFSPVSADIFRKYISDINVTR